MSFLPPGTNVTSPPPPLLSPETNLTVSPPPPGEVSPNGSTLPRPPGEGGLPPGALAGLIVGVALGALMVLVGVGICFFFYRRKKRKEAERNKDHDLPQRWQQNTPPLTDNKVKLPKPASPLGVASNLHLSPMLPNYIEPPSTSSSLGSKNALPAASSGIALGLSQSAFTYEELAVASDGFSNANLLGQGSFGYVHKGVLPNGKKVAIKQLKVGSGQGEREFRAEIEIISRVHHRHLVSLMGYCITGAQRMLVYEFVPNKTLEFHLHGKERPSMIWAMRMKIAIGSAKGLAYLHEDCHPKIIHRDIKAANILLDDSFEVKVADFGLAKYTLDTDTHISTRVMGTFGYLAPEYASTGKLSDKSDVFSFGVVLLELISGRRPVDRTRSYLDESIVDWARPLLKQAMEDGNYDAVVDPKLHKDYDSSEMARMIFCAAACVRHLAWFRPRMSQVVLALEGNMSLDDLSEGIAPGHSMAYSSESSDYNSHQYEDDMKKFRKMALECEEHGDTLDPQASVVSQEYSGSTSEYGQNKSSSSTEGQQTTQKELDSQRMEKNMKDSHESS